MNTLRSFETSETTRSMTRLAHRGRTEPYETSLCLALLDMVHTDTARISWGPREKNSANQMWVVQTPNIDKYYIHSPHTDGTLT